MGKMTNQCNRVLAWLEEHGSITDNEARDHLGINRVGARVWDLKWKRGIPIITKMEKGVNRFGEEVKYGVYYLVKEGEEDAGV